MKTAELTGPQLNYWVARANGWNKREHRKIEGVNVWANEKDEMTGIMPAEAYEPSTAWSDGGPIIEREGIGMMQYESGGWWAGKTGVASFDSPVLKGATPLEAAMRCYVACKFGEEVPEHESQPAPLCKTCGKNHKPGAPSHGK